jgi:pimeloyl-ACP methyl ester carboxylesterase
MLIDASVGVVDLVERMHRTIQESPSPFGKPVHAATRGLTGQIYRGIRGGMRLVGRGLDVSIGSVEGLLQEGGSTPRREIFVSMLNGVYGDYLASTRNPLTIEMCLRQEGGAALDVAELTALRSTVPRRRLLVLLHGLCMSDHQWLRDGRSHGITLSEQLDYYPLYLRYNSGLPIAENGHQLAVLLEQLIDGWPHPLDEFVILGHSLGGLVARSACAIAAEQGHDWLKSLTRLVFLGTPHCGAPLERAGHGLDVLLDVSPYSAPFARLGNARSAGIKDLRLGTITSALHRFVPLPTEVACYTMAATLASKRSPLGDRLTGDGLVPLHSALGQGRDKAHSLRFAQDRQWIGYKMGHLDLLHSPEAYEQLGAWLERKDLVRAKRIGRQPPRSRP